MTAKVPTSNAKNAHELLDEVRAVILKEPLRYNQHDTLYIRGRRSGLYPDYDAVPSCGTVGCVAGWATVLKRSKRLPADVLAFAEKLLGLSDWQARELFGPAAAGYDDDMQTKQHAKAGAAHIRKFQQKYRAQLLAKKV